MVKSVYLEKAKSKKTGNEYLSLVFDCGWTKQRVFVDHLTICNLFDLHTSDIANLKIGDCVPLKIEG